MGDGTTRREPWRHGEEAIWLLPVTVVSLLLFAAGQWAGRSEGLRATAIYADYSAIALKALPLLSCVALFAMALGALASGGASPLRTMLDQLRARFGSAPLMLAAALPLLLMPVMLSGYGVLKMVMPIHAPFAWDARLAAADRLLFFGHQPWELTHALLGSFAATLVIDRIYTTWILLLSFAIIAFSLFAPRYDRARFFLCFTVAWPLLGVIGAYLLSSAGPCYAALTGSPFAADYAPLMERLRHYSEARSTLGAVQWQAILWDAHVNRHYSFGMGISAMPSLHNAIAMLYALALARFGRGWAIAGWTFAAIIFVGSIHLGWHYAVDGIVSSAAMLLIWRAAGWYLELSGYARTTSEDYLSSEDVRQPALA